MRYLLFFILALPSCLRADLKQENIKVLVLIIASDHYNGTSVPIYTELENVWRAYMHLDSEHVEAYFIKANPDLSSPYKIENDIIWSKTVDNLMPGILNKTIHSLECLSNRLHEFDYVLRTNLSSFFVFPSLLEALKPIPKTRCYFGSNNGEERKIGPIGSGCGFVISSDVAQDLVDHKEELLDKMDYDDVLIGEYLIKKGIFLLSAPRLDFSKAKTWIKYKHLMKRSKSLPPYKIFHYRIKHPKDHFRLDQKVYEEDLYIHYDMLDYFYGVKRT